MQFYIVHSDPEQSAKMLPDYALKKVNLREGWQIISDIAHIHNITFEGQNKCYSKSHALTRHFCSTKKNFIEFINNYLACLNEYENRYNYITIWHNKFCKLIFDKNYSKILDKISKNKYENCRNYLLTEKSKHLTQKEIKRLKSGD